MVKKSSLILILIASLVVAVVSATSKSYTDAEIFAQAAQAGQTLGMPTDISEAAPRLGANGQITRTTECWWLYGRPKTDSQQALVICEYQIKVTGTYGSWIVSNQTAPQLPSLIEQMKGYPRLDSFMTVTRAELAKVQNMTFIASRRDGITFPTPAQFQP